MKTLFIQIPCFNEAQTLPVALAALPRKVKGFDAVKWIVINDGSTDRTVEVAQENGVDYIVNHVRNQGLAKAFMTGIEACVQLGTDVIVNTDADNQYNSDEIPLLITPILEGRAEIVIGTRPIYPVEHFSPMKKFLQKCGSWVVRIASKTDIADTTSGFRALSREAARQIVVFTDYTYTLETIIQAGQKNMAIISVPIRVTLPTTLAIYQKHIFLHKPLDGNDFTHFRHLPTLKFFRENQSDAILFLGFRLVSAFNFL